MRLPRSPVVAVLGVVLLLPPATACSQEPSPDPAARLTATSEPSRPATAAGVLAISVDGLNTTAITRLGRRGAPTLHRLLAEGAGTLNARTEAERTITLPNHTSMMTGRRVDRTKGGHGVTWSRDRPGSTVQKAAGHRVASIFTVVHAAGGRTALYSTKAKFGLFRRSWPAAIDRFTVRQNQRRLVRLAARDLAHRPPMFTFLHVSLPDRAGHRSGGMSRDYLAAVRRTDRQLRPVIAALAGGDLAVVLTADHGFARGRRDHSARKSLQNYRIPFLTWGAGVGRGDLYAMNPGLRDPGSARPSYAGRQPVRNGDLANVAGALLGLDPVPGSTMPRARPIRLAAGRS